MVLASDDPNDYKIDLSIYTGSDSLLENVDLQDAVIIMIVINVKKIKKKKNDNLFDLE